MGMPFTRLFVLNHEYYCSGSESLGEGAVFLWVCFLCLDSLPIVEWNPCMGTLGESGGYPFCVAWRFVPVFRRLPDGGGYGCAEGEGGRSSDECVSSA